jgi:hypothetical protein
MKSTTNRANMKFENWLNNLCIQDFSDSVKHGRRTRSLFHGAKKTMAKAGKSLAWLG